jgi:plastocyanin
MICSVRRLVVLAVCQAVLILSVCHLSAATTNVNVGDNFYSPANVTIKTGDTVNWTWVGTRFHDVRANDDSWSSGDRKNSGTFSRVFSAVGTFPYYCTVHSTPTNVNQNGTIVVQSSAAAPTVTITSPTSGTIFTAPASISLSANASDSDGTVVSVQFLRSGTSLVVDTAAPYTTTDTNVPRGSYVYSAVATDNSGRKATNTVNILVNERPTVTITNPVANAVFTAPATIVIQASATDVDGTITNVQFFRGTTSLGNDNTNPYSITNSGVAAGTYTYSAVASDNRGAKNTNSISVTVNDPNAAPTLSGSGGTLAYAEGSGAVAVDTSVTVADPDGVNLASATISIMTNFIAGEDSLGFANQNGITGSYNASTGVLTLTGSSSIANYQTALRSVTYSNSSADPLNAVRTISFTATDAAATSVAYARNVSITPVNNPPVVSGAAQALVYVENTTMTVDPSVSVSDPDDGVLQNAVIWISSGFQPSEDRLLYIPGIAPMPNTYDTNTGALRLNASTSLDVWMDALRHVFYRNTSDNPNTTPRTISFSISDGTTTNTNSYSVTVTIQRVNDDPTVSITSPANNSSFPAPATITLQADAADVDGTVTNVLFMRGSTVLGNDTTAPYSITDSGLPVGSYSYFAIATDNQGARATNSISVTVTPPANVAPTVTITSPTNNSSFFAPANIALQATASDSDGSVTQVEWFRGANFIGAVTNSPYSLTDSGIAAGSYTYSAVAVDNVGARATNSVAVTVLPPNTAPTIAITSPSAGFVFAAPANITVQANATDNDGSVTNVSFTLGSQTISDTSAPFSGTFSNVATGNYTVTAVASDNAGATKSTSVSLSVVTPVNVVLTPLQRTSSTFAFSFTANTGLRYTIERKDSLTANSWLTLTNVSANASRPAYLDTAATNANNFYRVGRLPNP